MALGAGKYQWACKASEAQRGVEENIEHAVQGLLRDIHRSRGCHRLEHRVGARAASAVATATRAATRATRAAAAAFVAAAAAFAAAFGAPATPANVHAPARRICSSTDLHSHDPLLLPPPRDLMFALLCLQPVARQRVGAEGGAVLMPLAEGRICSSG